MIELLKNKLNKENEMHVVDMIEDVLKHLSNDDKGEFKTTQEFARLKELFRGIVAKD